ncbi:MAG TPA: acyl carrier protein [Anaerolineaceae bacterium]|nr:acyl carrier protein [Anaerolineaceae bacterium]
MEDFRETIRSYIAESILFSGKGFPYSDDVSFLENGIIDSMNIMEIVMFAEEKFGIQIRDEEIIPDNLDSVNRLAEFIVRKKEAELVKKQI